MKRNEVMKTADPANRRPHEPTQLSLPPHSPNVAFGGKDENNKTYTALSTGVL